MLAPPTKMTKIKVAAMMENADAAEFEATADGTAPCDPVHRYTRPVRQLVHGTRHGDGENKMRTARLSPPSFHS